VIVPWDGKGGPSVGMRTPSILHIPLSFCSKLLIYLTPLVLSFPPDLDDTDSRPLDVML